LLYNAARLYAQAAGQVETAARPGEDPEQRRKYESRAVELLRQGLLALPEGKRAAMWNDTIRLDRAFDPIRRGAAYLELAAKYPALPKALSPSP
jgi:hypothetical protein